MKVKELIKQLQNFDEEYNIVLDIADRFEIDKSLVYENDEDKEVVICAIY